MQELRSKEDLIREARRAYQKAWRKKNKEKVALYNRRFWEKRALTMKQNKEEQSDV